MCVCVCVCVYVCVCVTPQSFISGSNCEVQQLCPTTNQPNHEFSCSGAPSTGFRNRVESVTRTACNKRGWPPCSYRVLHPVSAFPCFGAWRPQQASPQCCCLQVVVSIRCHYRKAPSGRIHMFSAGGRSSNECGRGHRWLAPFKLTSPWQ